MHNFSTPYKLDNLTEFNRFLVYGLAPEASLKETIIGDLFTLLPDHLFHLAGQYQDMFNAYLYMQNEMLPEFRKSGLADITVEQILKWMDQTHKHIAATIIDDMTILYPDCKSGEITKLMLNRWHTGLAMQYDFAEFLINKITLKQLQDKYKNSFAKSDINAFAKLLKKIRDDETIENFPDQEIHLKKDSPNFISDKTFMKLGAVYNKSLLSPEDKTLVLKFLKICLHPSAYPAARVKFAAELIKQWQSCDPNNIDKIAKLAFHAFYGITDLHCYPNGNGRTATAFMNFILRSLNKPSIVLRTPNYRSDPKSTYSIGIDKIDTQPELMIEHIKNRIIASEMNKDHCKDEKLEEIARLQIEIAKLILAIRNLNPRSFINEFYKEVLIENNDIYVSTLAKGTTKNIAANDELKKTARLVGLRNTIEKIKKFYRTLLINKLPPVTSNNSASIPTLKKDDADKIQPAATSSFKP